jgi:hypothetical protein
MDALNGIVFIQLPLFLLVGAVATSLVWWQHEGALCRRVGGTLSSGLKVVCVAALAGVWALLTLICWWCLFLATYLAVFSMYALFGVVAAWAALIGAGALFLIAPVVWGVILVGLARREFRYASVSSSMRVLPSVRAMPEV